MLKTIKNGFRRQFESRKDVAVNNPDALARIAADTLTNMSVTCRCGEISIPTKLVGNIYRCIRCQKEKVHISYNFDKAQILCNPLVNMDLYDEAIILLKKDKKKRLTIKEIKYRLEN